MEILDVSLYSEYESFVSHHPNGTLTQSILWHDVKHDWGHEVVVTRNERGKICGGVSVLIKKVPVLGTTLLYAPRGPVCDYNDKKVLEELQKGVDIVALKHKGYLYKIDPDLSVEKGETFMAHMKEMNFERFAEPTGFESIQTRFNHRLNLVGKDEAQILGEMHHKTRYNIRLAGRKGVTIEVKGEEGLDDFIRLMEVTGERDDFSIRSRSYFETMLSALGKHVRLYVAYFEGKAIAGAVTSNYGRVTSYIYGASDNAHRNVMAPYLLQWEMIRWAQQTGCSQYDFMGVSGDLSEDSPLYGLYRFKSGFGGHVDELVGEFDYVYKPISARLTEIGLTASEFLRKMKRKFKASE